MTGAARGIICGGGRGATGAEPRTAGPAGAVPGREGGAVRGAAAGAAGTRAGRADAPPSAWRNQSRMRASSSGVTPANRTCASGEARTTRPQVSNPPQDRRTVSPAWKGSPAAACTPAAVTVACASWTRLPRAPTCTAEGAPRSGA